MNLGLVHIKITLLGEHNYNSVSHLQGSIKLINIIIAEYSCSFFEGVIIIAIPIVGRVHSS